MAWAQHHPRLGVVVADAWAERTGICAKPGEVELYILEALMAEADLLGADLKSDEERTG